MEVMLRGKGWLAKLAGLYNTDIRRHTRLRAEFTGTLSGPFGMVHVSGKNLNRKGAGVESPQELPQGSLVFLRISDLGLMGFAHVRHCSPSGEGYYLGLEFREGLSRERDDEANWEYQRYARATYRPWDEAEF
jgi:hypothetical protein